MPLEYQVLGKPFLDNALWVVVQTGQLSYRLLFDCGESVLHQLDNSEIQKTEHLFFSHCHMDHISGFDTFCRLNYSRPDMPIFIWGPTDVDRVISHRLRGFTWNLILGQPGTWHVHSILSNHKIQQTTYYTKDAFENQPEALVWDWDTRIYQNPHYEVRAIILEHGTPSIGYVVCENSRWNVDKNELAKLNIPPGVWLHAVKDISLPDSQKISIGTLEYELGDIRNKILTSTPGDTIAYLTDFSWEENLGERLSQIIPPQAVIICESQYHDDDRDLAKKNQHLTSIQAGHIAKSVSARKLILIHVSQRYLIPQLQELLDACRGIFAETYFPEGWHI